MTTWIATYRSPAPFILMTLFLTLFSWAGGLPVLRACGEEIPLDPKPEK